MTTVRRFLKLAAPFWFNRQQWREWLLLVAVIGFALGIVHIGVWIAAWNKIFYDALAALNGQTMPALVIEYLGYLTLTVACIACGNWLRKILLFRWREHLTHQFEQHWLSSHNHYRLQINTEPDNPDQRMAEDIYLLAEKSIDLFKYFIMNAAKLVAFTAILWQLSGIQTFTISGQSFRIHGYLVWVALVYSVLCTLAGHLIGNKLQTLHIERQHREADYRASLLRVRDHSEQIALYHGETAEQSRLQQRFNHIKRNWYALIGCELKFESFSAAYLRLSMFIPIIATLPMYLARTMTFGDMMQSRSAFGNVQDGFGWFLDYYKRIMEWAAVVERLAGFQDALDHIEKQVPSAGPHWHLTPTPANTPNNNQPASLQLEGLAVHTAQGQLLLHGITLNASAPEWLLLDGHSGIGKSTLLRTLAGLWPYYTGNFKRPSSSFLFLPQHPYLPQASLRSTVSYPHPPCTDNAALHRTLQQAGLAHLYPLLDEEQEWHRILSGGEQQRISLVRALLHQPALLFLDEATSHLDEQAALQLMQTLRCTLPNTLCVGTCHQNHIKALFDTTLDLTGHSARIFHAA